ncbi:thiol reductant ABC exporter subunit CydC [Fodinicurvata fenggangensis]|uniref:thiol reductant ABC exporter subunit CydC n=1 Tax=Fodinicurvata fenggangensis TaxID=1121830 RepID=UPI00047BDC63|nr:thiol reductant ABC exporter subunit CydC [Fodinicurvata fenggangensis]
MSSGVQDLKTVLSIFRKERPAALLGGALLAAATVLFGIALLGLSGWFITATAIAGLSMATALAFDVFAPSAGIRFFALGRTFARYGERVVTHDATLRVLAAMRTRLFRGWAAPGAARLLLKHPAKLLFRLTSDVDALDSLYLRLLVPAAVAVIAALATAVTLGLMAPWLGIAVGLLLLTAGLGLPALTAGRALRPAQRRAQALESLRGRVVDLLSGQTELLMTGQLAAQTARVQRAEQHAALADDRLDRLETSVDAGLGAVSALLLAGTLLGVAWLVEAGTISAPLAALGMLVVLAAMEPFAALRRGAVELGRTLLAARRLAPRLSETDQSNDTPLAAPGDGSAIRLEGVTLCHPGSSAPVLEEVSLAVRPGEHVALVGASGSGKSTLLAAIAGELQPSDGQLETRDTCLLPQRTELFRGSLRDNLHLAKSDASDNCLEKVLMKSGLGADDKLFGRGLDTVLGEGGAGLSGGQARRLALARVLLRETSVWLFDEPTQGLDGETARDVLGRIRTAAEGRTLVIATHIKREADLADRLVVLEAGRIVATAERGTAAFAGILDGLRPD